MEKKKEKKEISPGVPFSCYSYMNWFWPMDYYKQN